MANRRGSQGRLLFQFFRDCRTPRSNPLVSRSRFRSPFRTLAPPAILVKFPRFTKVTFVHGRQLTTQKLWPGLRVNLIF
jgi:hypothetical protein